MKRLIDWNKLYKKTKSIENWIKNKNNNYKYYKMKLKELKNNNKSKQNNKK